MPKDRPQGTFSGGSLLPRWLRALWSWEEVAICGGHRLVRNTVTGERQAHRLPNSPHTAVPQQWIETGTHPCERPTPPSGGSSGQRASIFPHFCVSAPMPQPPKGIEILRFARPDEVLILGPNDRVYAKPRIRVPYRREPA